MDPTTIPTEAEITPWLTRQGHPSQWASSLAGLRWGYIEPVVTIAANTGNHPMVALATAAAYSTDPAFKRAAADHIAAHGGAPTPNRAQRRAASGRDSRARKIE